MFTALMAQADADQVLEWLVAVHSTSVRAHQHAAGAPFAGSGRVLVSTLSAGPVAD
ncbi:hypothetical protein ACWCOW_18880 [Streptomyces sp. NPDC001939]|uniref:hypothetical protein n=1 Tax=Streptomyces sp. NPDC056210 TaxID=3345746 RepID=UPI0035D715EA